jgi:signal transduction histidine kinase
VPGIRVIQGPDAGTELELPQGNFTIGRWKCDLTLGDTTCSRQHAKFSRHGDDCILVDLGSTNYTFLNGVRLSRPVKLRQGDCVRCGKTIIEFQEEQPDPPVAFDAPEEAISSDILATVTAEDARKIGDKPAALQTEQSLLLLYDLIAECVTTFQPELLLQHVLDRVFEDLQAERGFVALLQPDGTLRQIAARYIGDARHADTPLPKAILDQCLASEVGILTENASRDERFAGDPDIRQAGVRSALCVPLMGRSPVGILHLDCCSKDRAYTEHELRLLTAVGLQTGLSLEHAQLLGDLITNERLAAIGETVAYLSHHIKNILQSLTTSTDSVALAIQDGSIDRAATHWPNVEHSLERVNDLILNMLAYSKKRLPRSNEANVNDLMSEVLRPLRHVAEERGIQFEITLGELPMLPADADGLRQLFMNLLNNAIDAVEKDTGVIEVSTRYDEEHRVILVEISDNGQGIASADMVHIFTPFFSRKGQGGTGLGLAVAKKVVNEHDGHIHAESTVGQGTRFHIALPLPPEPIDEDHHEEPQTVTEMAE